jgi:hypothetical protein
MTSSAMRPASRPARVESTETLPWKRFGAETAGAGGTAPMLVASVALVPGAAAAVPAPAVEYSGAAEGDGASSAKRAQALHYLTLVLR